jgi:hypothetical protein
MLANVISLCLNSLQICSFLLTMRAKVDLGIKITPTCLGNRASTLKKALAKPNGSPYLPTFPTCSRSKLSSRQCNKRNSSSPQANFNTGSSRLKHRSKTTLDCTFGKWSKHRSREMLNTGKIFKSSGWKWRQFSIVAWQSWPTSPNSSNRSLKHCRSKSCLKRRGLPSKSFRMSKTQREHS